MNEPMDSNDDAPLTSELYEGPGYPSHQARRGISLSFGVVLPIACAVLTFIMMRDRHQGIEQWCEILGAAGVGVANFLALKSIPKRSPRLQGMLGGFALGFSVFYAILFVPAYGAGFIGLLYCGVGLFVFAPILAAGVSFCVCVGLSRSNSAVPLLRPIILAGVLIGLGLAGYTDLKIYLTAKRVDVAHTGSAEERAAALRWLRNSADPKAVRYYCQSPPSGRHSAFFYRHSYGSSTWGRMLSGSLLKPPWFHAEPRFDEELEVVGYLATGEASMPSTPWNKAEILSSSVMGTIDTDAGQAQLQWDLAIKRPQDMSGPAMFKVALPKHATLSDVQRDDVSHHDPRRKNESWNSGARRRFDNRIPFEMLDGRTALVSVDHSANEVVYYRLWISVPMTVKDDIGTVAFPSLSSINVRAGLVRESQFSLESPLGLGAETSSLGSLSPTTIAGEINLESHPHNGHPYIYAKVDFVAEPTAADSQDPPPATDRPMIIVTDATRGMGPYLELLQEALNSDHGLRISELVVATDSVKQATDLTAMSNLLDELRPHGGFDSQPALDYARSRAALLPGSTVVWLCGAQPMKLYKAPSVEDWLGRDSALRVFILNPQEASNVVASAMLPHRSVSRLTWNNAAANPVLRALRAASRNVAGRH